MPNKPLHLTATASNITNRSTSHPPTRQVSVNVMPHNQRSVAVFKWDGELPGFDESDPERLTILTAQAPAEALHGALRSRGYHTNAATPYAGEGGWHFTVEVGGQTFGVFTHWTGIADQDYFAVQIDLKRGVLATLFRKPVRDERLEPGCRALVEAFAMLPKVRDLQWLSDEQFAASYCRGEPLPAADQREA